MATRNGDGGGGRDKHETSSNHMDAHAFHENEGGGIPDKWEAADKKIDSYDTYCQVMKQIGFSKKSPFTRALLHHNSIAAYSHPPLEDT